MSLHQAGRLVGFLLLALLPAGLIVPYVVLKPLTVDPAAFLTAAAAMEGAVRLNVFLLFLGGCLPVAISVATWPALRERGPALGLGLLALAASNFTLQMVENAHWLTLLSVSRAAVEAGASGAEAFRPLGVVIRLAWKWAHYAHIAVVVGWFFVFYLALLCARVMPRGLAALGMITCVLHTAGITLPTFAGVTVPFAMPFGMSLGLATLAAAGWLMARGFSAPRVAGSAAISLEGGAARA